MDVIEQAQDKVVESLNAEGRSISHIALGAGLCAVLVGVTAAASVMRAQPPAPGGKPTRDPMIRAIWPSIFSVTTLAALRIWNAPRSPQKRKALVLWGVLQAANLAVTLWRPRRQAGQLVSASAIAGLTTLYAHAAADVDQKAAAMSAPTGFAGLASLAATPSR